MNKKITIENLSTWISEHETLSSDFKTHFGFAPEDIRSHISDVIPCTYEEIDVSKDKDWKDVNQDLTINDDYELYDFIETKYGNNVTWFALDQAGEQDTIMIIDDSAGSVSKIKLIDSRLFKKSSKRGK